MSLGEQVARKEKILTLARLLASHLKYLDSQAVTKETIELLQGTKK